MGGPLRSHWNSEEGDDTGWIKYWLRIEGSLGTMGNDRIYWLTVRNERLVLSAEEEGVMCCSAHRAVNFVLYKLTLYYVETEEDYDWVVSDFKNY